MKKILAALCALTLCFAGVSSASAAQPPEKPAGAPPGGQTAFEGYTALKTFSEDCESAEETFASTGADENAVLIESGNVNLDRAAVSRVSADSAGGDAASFYGVGAAILATGGAAYITNAEISTDAAGGAGAFAYGDGAVYIADSTIKTEQNASGGIHAAGGGALYAWDLDVTTNGGSAAAIRSDRGGGEMRIDGGRYVSNGVGSPAVYSTADIAVSNATLAANGSEAVCVEGRNSLRLADCTLTGNMADDAQNDCTWTVIVYQSMSGDSEVGCGAFQMTGGKLVSNNGGLFYTTNTESEILLQNVEIEAAADSEFFLRCSGNENRRGWGETGSNGADCTFTADRQSMDGDVIWDSISTLRFYMQNGSTLTGAFINDESCAGNGGDGYAELILSADSTWIVTDDSTLTALYGTGQILDEAGRSVTVKSARGDVFLEGDSDLQVTVETYAEAADFSGAVEIAETEKAQMPESMRLRRADPAPAGEETAAPEEENEAADGVQDEINALDASNRNALYVVIGIAAVCAAGAALAAVMRRKKR